MAAPVPRSVARTCRAEQMRSTLTSTVRDVDTSVERANVSSMSENVMQSRLFCRCADRRTITVSSHASGNRLMFTTSE